MKLYAPYRASRTEFNLLRVVVRSTRAVRSAGEYTSTRPVKCSFVSRSYHLLRPTWCDPYTRSAARCG